MAAANEWIKKIDISNLLEGDAALIHEKCGMEALIKLTTALPGLSLYISERWLQTARKRYIEQEWRAGRLDNPKRMAAEIGVSTSFVYNVLANIRRDQETSYQERQERLL